MTTGAQLQTFITSLNGGAAVEITLSKSLVDVARTIIEEERSWMVLRKTNTSKTASGANTWQTAIDLSTITDFSRFYGEDPVILFDGTNRREYYRQVPWDRRLEYKDVGNTFCFDENSKNIYLNGVVPFSGTLYINYMCTSTEVDLESTSAVWTLFPSRYLPLLGFYAVGIFKGAVDYDSINRLMTPENRAAMMALKSAMEKWDNERQMSSLESNDPTERGDYPRSGAVNVE